MIDRQALQHTFRHARTISAILAGISALLYVASGLYVVAPEQSGVVIRFGEIVDDAVPPGIHYHWPWPVETILRPRATEVRGLEIPFLPDNERPEIGELLTGDENLVRATLLVQYTLAQPRHFLTTAVDPEALLVRLIRAHTLEHLATLPVDVTLTTGRDTIQRHLKQALQKQADAIPLGIRLTAVQVRSIEPPDAAGVAQAFKAVASAREEKQKMVEQAEGERNRRLPKARSDAQALLREGEGYHHERVERARGNSARFLATLSAYQASKSITAHRMHVETAERILSRVKLMLVNPEAEQRP